MLAVSDTPDAWGSWGDVHCLGFSRHGALLASGHLDGVIRLWHFPGAELLLSMSANTAAVTSMVFSPTAAVLASGHTDGMIRLWDVSGVPDTPSGPALYVVVPPHDTVLRADTSSQRVQAFVHGHDGPWAWRTDSPFPDSGPAGGNTVPEGTSVTIDGLENGETYTFYAALVDEAGSLLEPSATSSVTFSVAVPEPTHRYEVVLPAGLSIFSPILRALVFDGPFGAIDTRPSGVPMARHLIEAGATVVVRMVDGRWQPVIGRDGAMLVGDDFPIEPGTGYVVNLMRPLAFTMEGQVTADEIETPAAPGTQIDTAWMFALAGHVTDFGLLPESSHVRVRNLRTAQHADLEIATDGTFLGAIGDEDQAAVVGVYDELTFELVSRDGYALGSRLAARVAREDLRRAYRMVTLSARPETVRLLPNYPNPFNPETWIPFELSEDAAVTMRIYGPQGAQIRELELGRRPAGYHVSREAAAHWDGRNASGEPASSGLYLVELRAGSRRETGRVLLSK